MPSPFTTNVAPDFESFCNCIMQAGSPSRVHHIELFLDGEIKDEICKRYNVLSDVDPADPYFDLKSEIAIQRFLGYDFVKPNLENVEWLFKHNVTEDTADLSRDTGRSFQELHTGPITNWDEFENYPWPNPATATSRALAWYEKNLPDDMGVIAWGVGHYMEFLSMLMGYETLCFALHDDPKLVQAIYEKILDIDTKLTRFLLQFDRVKMIWGSDDMGFRSGTLIGPDDLRKYVLPGHKKIAALTHDAGRIYLLHSCGKLDAIMDDLIDDVKIDAKHSYEDTIAPPDEFKARYHPRLAVLGGIDVDFLCRSDEQTIRSRVRKTLDACQSTGRYCLGTGNSVANYIPVDNYLAMLDEGRKYSS